jgi:endonuclease/exonuclease/phosphatase family metal-dependent hydrolase
VNSIHKSIICKFAIVSGTFREIRKKIWLILNIGVVLWVLVGAYCMLVPPYEFWPAAFIAFSLPGALILNILFLLYWLLKRSWYVILPLSVLLFGWNYYGRLLAINPGEEEPGQEAKTVQVLSFNTHAFSAYDDREAGKFESSIEMIDWVSRHPADVFCLQEFYSRKNSDVFNTVSRIGIRYDKDHYFSSAQSDRHNAKFGIAIFSKHPILDRGEIIFDKNTANRVLWADLDMKGDTIRVYAVHLQSMSIKATDIENTYSSIGNEDSFKREGRNVARRLRKGFIARGHQVELLIEHFQKSPYPFIVSGDFNDIPFSYTYNELAKELDNAMVEAGTGVGATYNGPIPFLRIDNQFYSKGLRAYDFKTYHEMGLSDHFPISAKYVLEKEER